MAGTNIRYAQGSLENVLYENILDRSVVEPVTLIMIMLKTHAVTVVTIVGHYS